MQVYIITTGGTIEGVEYNNPNQTLKTPPMPLENLLKRIENLPAYQIKRVLLKDSRFINDNDRALIALEIKKSKANKIIITHGTLTMVETAQYLGKLIFDKTIVLTGALILGTEPKTDAIDNLSFAFGCISTLEKGVYVVMHHEIFNWNNVRKNTQENQFEKTKK